MPHPEEDPVSTTPTPTYEGEWWNDLPSVDGEPPRLSREPETIPTAEGQVYLDELAERLTHRAEAPDVLDFIGGGDH